MVAGFGCEANSVARSVASCTVGAARPPGTGHAAPPTACVGEGMEGAQMAGLELVEGSDWSRGAAPMGVSGRGGRATDQRVAELVASQVIPRLLLSCRANAEAPRPSQTHIDTLARLALSRDPGAAAAQVFALRDAGMTVDSLLNDLIGPAAMRLGEFWCCDSADFAEVAIGAGRLVSVARELGVEAERTLPPGAPRALIASPESERHGLGALIVVQSFRSAGWRVTATPGAAPEAIARQAAETGFDIVGLSVGSDRAGEGLADLIARIRAASRNPRVIVALGGPSFAHAPEAASALGADFAAGCAREAVAKAESLLQHRASAAH